MCLAHTTQTWVADSFQGLPKADRSFFDHAFLPLNEYDALSVSQEEAS